jgi:hypothetical protein
LDVISRSLWSLVCAAVVGTSACGQTPSNFVEVRVLTDGQNCIVYTQKMHCDAVGAYLKDNRHLPFSQSILLGLDGRGDAARARGQKAGHSLSEVGYSNVMSVGFITEPRAASDAEHEFFFLSG